MSEKAINRLHRLLTPSGAKDEAFAFGLSDDAVADYLINLAARIRTGRVIVTDIARCEMGSQDDFTSSTVLVTYAEAVSKS